MEDRDAYGEFALFYDQLMQDAPYERWMAWFEEALERYQLQPRHIADLGCGTGTLSHAFFEQGFKVTGVDLSEEMLAIAESKREGHSPRLRFLCQDLRDLYLPEPCDIAVSFCDSLNYLTEADDLRAVFARTKAALRPGGVFLFDVHSVYKLREKLGQNVFYEVGDEVSYIWQSRYEEETPRWSTTSPFSRLRRMKGCTVGSTKCTGSVRTRWVCCATCCWLPVFTP